MNGHLLVASLVLVPLMAGGADATPTRDRIQVDPSEVQIGTFGAPGDAFAANTRTIYLNRCVGGCAVTRGTTDSRTNRSSIATTGRLSPLARSEAVWTSVVSCMQDVFARTNTAVQIVTTDPGNVPHFEIMFGGSPGELGFADTTGGVSPWTCAGDYIANSLVFVFDVWGNNVEDLCSTAAQEVAHSWQLDHVTLASDPLTYFGFTGRRYYKDQQAQCGSVCVDGESTFCLACSGQSHACSCSGTQTQNSVATIRALFGTSQPTPPTVSIVSPSNGQVLDVGFGVEAALTDEQGISLVELLVDGQVVASKERIPYVFATPATLAPGPHTIEIRGTDAFGAVAKSPAVMVSIAMACEKPADCPLDTDTCISNRCVPGTGVQGGLGSSCVDGTECASGQCASDSMGTKYCVERCTIGGTDCPGGFDCIAAGEAGVCWPGGPEDEAPDANDDDDINGCSTSGGSPAWLVALGALFVLGRRRRAA